MVQSIRNRLYDLQDSKYKDFHCKLIPTVAADTVIGVRTPALRAYAKSLKAADTAPFLSDLPHKYYDENNLHALLIMGIRDFDTSLAAVKAFLPYVDNWATCDLLRPACFKAHKAELLEEIKDWLASPHTYTLRFGMEMLMLHFMDEDFESCYLDWVAELRSDEYYVNMMLAWFFATAITKQWEAALPYIENRRLDKWVHNKAIQKAIESYQVPVERKAYLRTLRIK